MPPGVLRSRRPRGEAGRLAPIGDTDRVAGHLEDASHFPGGHTRALFLPASEAEVAGVLQRSERVLAIGAQSSLTGGATPMGDTLLGTSRLNGIEAIGPDWVRVQPGVSLAALDAALAAEGRDYPPVPTFQGAFVGGIVSTNAAGAATFKYGATRRWVRAITVVLASGDVLDIERGVTHAHPDGFFELDLAGGSARVPVPSYRMPAVPKLSAGYFAEPGMDLIDLFIGSEGTLGVITSVTLSVLPERRSTCLAFMTLPDRDAALSLVARLRQESMAAWRTGDRSGIDVSSVEHMDRRALDLVRANGIDRRHHLTIPDDGAMGLLIGLEVDAGLDAARMYDEIGRLDSGAAPDTGLTRFCALLAEYGALERTELAAPEDCARRAQLFDLREAVPAAVNQQVGWAQGHVDPRITKCAADTAVPFDRIGAFLEACDAEAARGDLDLAVWGHLSDGNLHPNVIPRAAQDVERGADAIRALGREAIRLGGTPLAEHGVGRNPVKQQLLIDLYGESGVDEMRRVKAALDPEWKLAPGVIFSRK